MWFWLLNLFSFALISSANNLVVSQYQYDPTWESLDSRPLPTWYDENKIGIFIHWGVFSVPSFGSEWFWTNWKSGNQKYVDFMKNNYRPGFTYQDFARDFTAEFFNPNQWAEIFNKSGARYVVLTSKHHEGYTLWPSKYSFSWNSKDVGPGRDLVGELAEAVKKAGMKFGLYHSLFEWYHPLYLSDKASGFNESNFVDKKIIPEMMELINTYEPYVLWSDGDWEASDDYWKAKDFLAWLYNDSPVKDYIVANDRWGRDIPCKHGDFFTCQDRYNPGVLQPHKWENAMTLDKNSWGFRREAVLSDYLTIKELLVTLVQTISCRGNLLINVGPTRDGMIAPIFEERLTQLGDWLSINGEGVYGSKPWQAQNETDVNVWYTSDGNNTVYAFMLDWPSSRQLFLKESKEFFVSPGYVFASFLGSDDVYIPWYITKDAIRLDLPEITSVKGNWVWCLKLIKSRK